jgi:hypothetical protein
MGAFISITVMLLLLYGLGMAIFGEGRKMYEKHKVARMADNEQDNVFFNNLVKYYEFAPGESRLRITKKEDNNYVAEFEEYGIHDFWGKDLGEIASNKSIGILSELIKLIGKNKIDKFSIIILKFSDRDYKGKEAKYVVEIIPDSEIKNILNDGNYDKLKTIINHKKKIKTDTATGLIWKQK